ncbi:MAG: glycerophosphodiester phosphodiesterase family protein [Fulvivirga sp.]|uniref:glycerophosphodiester phosphodiesterase family protein n=3 Tax=Fulvivirga sp. TaxID=1931237 RepID=UPI0032EDD1E0
MNKVATILICIISFQLNAQSKLDIQGHRGARGVFPENSVPAFLYALDQGVTTLEMDVVISKDGKVVVSHEPYLSSVICLDSLGNEITPKQEQNFNIYKMNSEEVAKCDCGSKGNPRFKDQIKTSTTKPLLEDVIKAVEEHIKSETLFEVYYNIELKTEKNGDGVFHPNPSEFSKLVYQLIDQYLPWNRIIIQSFDFRILRHWNEQYPDVKIAALIENTKSVKTNLQELGFTPDIYSPYYKLLSEKKISELHKLGIKVIPWTVNEKSDMQNLVKWKIDGIITDYPNRAAELGYITPKISKED